MREGGAAARDLDVLVPYHEGLYRDLKALFRTVPPGRIACVFFASAEEKAAATGRGGNAHVDYERNAVYAVYSDAVKALGYHEPCHLFDRAARGVRGGGWAFVEGLAVALDGRWSEGGISGGLDDWVIKAVKEGRLFSIDRLPAESRTERTQTTKGTQAEDSVAPGAYAWAGSFVQYLLTAHGWEALDRYRRTGDVGGAFGVGLGELDGAWRRWVVDGEPLAVAPGPPGLRIELPPEWKRDPMGFAEGADPAVAAYLHREGGGHLFVQRHPPGTAGRIAGLYERRARAEGTNVGVLYRGPQTLGESRPERLSLTFEGKDGRPRRTEVYTWDREDGPVSVGIHGPGDDFDRVMESGRRVLRSVKWEIPTENKNHK